MGKLPLAFAQAMPGLHDVTRIGLRLQNARGVEDAFWAVLAAEGGFKKDMCGCYETRRIRIE